MVSRSVLNILENDGHTTVMGFSLTLFDHIPESNGHLSRYYMGDFACTRTLEVYPPVFWGDFQTLPASDTHEKLFVPGL